MSNFKWNKRSLIPLLLCGVLFGVLFAAPASVYAAPEWMQSSLNQLMDWGIMSGYPDGELHEDNPITRAEFVAMANRAFGYDETGSIPFTDVPSSAWYSTDINVAYNASYFTGTSPTTASPNARLTREQAVVLLAHCLRMEQTPGEVTEFTDGRSFSGWSQGFVKDVTRSGLISGYTDGSFRPQNNITRGEMARMLCNALGTLISEPGPHSLGSVYGNVTINTPKVTLRDTVIAGDLYITGGLGLSDVILEDVEVLGRIVVAGGGESEEGDPSVTLRHVTANDLIIDSLRDQFVSVSIDGNTRIENGILRTTAYLEDRTRGNRGLRNIYLEGDNGTAFTLSGNLKNVMNRTPGSTLTISKGTVETLTIDEKATGSRLEIATNTTVETLNLDTGTRVTGEGDIDSLIVSAPGSTVTMLPDSIVVRPGNTANIAGEVMDSKLAEEASETPRILSGYPDVRNIASTSAELVFSTNKSGTIYWAVSAKNDGPVSVDDLISPPAYGSSILRRGTLRATASNTEFMAKITGLQADGTYYVSAVLVDSHEWKSTRKVEEFTTPDDSVPAFSSGYPYMSEISNHDAWATVMSTKNCELYYAVLPKGSKAPTANDFRAESITGNFGFGQITLEKNVPDSFQVNTKELVELDTYDLYLWLTDIDGAKSSAVRKVSFTTVDKTPPEFISHPEVNAVKPTSIGFQCQVNEPATIYYAVVYEGTEYPKRPAGSSIGAIEWDDPENGVKWTDRAAMIQISSGMNALRSGRTTAKGDAVTNFTISGLSAETSYDIYYLAIDNAGNYTTRLYKITASTQDNGAPKATQEFTRYSGNVADVPYADTDVRIIFSENIRRASTDEILLTLYNNVEIAEREGNADRIQTAKEDLAEALRNTMKLYNATNAGPPQLVTERTGAYDDSASWTVDYRNVTLKMEEGKLVVTFPTSRDNDPAVASANSALNLKSGGTYFFRLEDIADLASAKNLMGITDLPRFTTISAQVALANDVNVSSLSVGGKTIEADITFSLTPLSTAKVEETIDWDMLLWMDTSSEISLYCREVDANNRKNILSDWKAVGTEHQKIGFTVPSNFSGYVGRSVGYDMNNGAKVDFPPLSELSEDKVYEYAIHFNSVEGIEDRDAMSQYITGRVSVITGNTNELRNLGADVSQNNLSNMVTESLIEEIHTPNPFNIRKQFKDEAAPHFTGGYPKFNPNDTSAEMTLLLSRPGTVYYVIAPEGDIITESQQGGDVVFDDVPTSGDGETYTLSRPTYLDIVDPHYGGNPNIKTGSLDVGTGAIAEPISGLQPKTDYYVYFVIKGTGQVYSDVQLYRFTTPEVTRPIITLARDNALVTIRSNLNASVNYILLPYNNNLNELFSRDFADYADPKFEEELPESHKTPFTVLDALATDVVVDEVSAGSLFDLYANQSIKDEVANYVSTTTADGSTVAGTGSATVAGGKSSTVDCSRMHMSPSTPYAFVAVGKSTFGSGNAFRATFPLYLLDKDTPKVIEVNSDLEVDQKTGAVSGNVSLIFDEYLYWSEPGNVPPTLYQVDRGPIKRDPTTDKKDFRSIGTLVATNPSGTISVVTNKSYKEQPTLAIDLKFTSSKSGAFITFDRNLSDGNSNVAPTALNIKVQVHTDANGEKYAEIIINSAWDGRTQRRN